MPDDPEAIARLTELVETLGRELRTLGWAGVGLVALFLVLRFWPGRKGGKDG